ncbi:MAG: hypothetical protein RIQ89_219 [Bacteroidota bacterium]|jgi:L-lactate dehydrogenase complex protein LldG
MQEATSREKMLKAIRKALVNKTDVKQPQIDWEQSVYKKENGSLEETFATAFTKIGGRFIYCENNIEFFENLIAQAQQYQWKKVYCFDPALQQLLNQIEFPFLSYEDQTFEDEITGITSCEALVARLGSVLVSSKSGSGRKLNVVPTVHVIVAYTSQLVADLQQGFELIKSKYGDKVPSMISNLAGPSRTADIEKTLVSPAHGPRDIYVFLIDNH